MSWNASGWAKRCRLGSPVLKAVLLVLSDYATEDATQFGGGLQIPEGWAVAWPSVKTIAGDAEVSRATVYDVLNRLEAIGVVGREPRHAESGRQKTSGYWIHWDRDPVKVAEVGEGPDPGPPPGRVQDLDGGVQPPGRRGPARQTPEGPAPRTQAVKKNHQDQADTRSDPVVGNRTVTSEPGPVENGVDSLSAASGAAASPPAPSSDQIRLRALGASRGRRTA